MEFPEVLLYVDGRPMVASKNNPEIIDDWPLHNSHGLNTTLTVGACWQGMYYTQWFPLLWLKPIQSFSNDVFKSFHYQFDLFRLK